MRELMAGAASQTTPRLVAQAVGAYLSVRNRDDRNPQPLLALFFVGVRDIVPALHHSAVLVVASQRLLRAIASCGMILFPRGRIDPS